MTDREILIWYEELEHATTNTDSPEAGIISHVRELLNRATEHEKASVAAALRELRQALPDELCAPECVQQTKNFIDARIQPDQQSALDTLIRQARLDEAEWWSLRTGIRNLLEGSERANRLAALRGKEGKHGAGTL